MTLTINDLESRRFLVRFARLADFAREETTLATQVAQADDQGIDIISARVDTTDLTTVRKLEDLGFRLMDTLIYYRRALPFKESSVADNGHSQVISLSSLNAGDCSSIALRAFHGYLGHYHADPRLCDDAADGAYADWIFRLLDDPADGQIAIGALIDGRVTGFLVGVKRDQLTSEIVLNAVDPSFQRGGAYTKLLLQYLRLVSSRGDETVIISTQIQNYGVQSVWHHAGFRPFESYHTLHRWSTLIA